MITLITGLPGNGKTLYALDYVSAWAKREGRPVWFHNIKGLSPELGWYALPTQTESINGAVVEVPQWWLCPANSIVLIDEAQMSGFGVRPRGAVPVWAQKLEVHRHLGLDLVMITQDPTLIDSHDRKLCELHFHVMRNFGFQRATVHEFRPVRENCLKSRKGSTEHQWAYPKHVFAWYTSAEAHTHKVRLPTRVYVLAGVLVVVPVIGYVLFTRLYARTQPTLTTEAAVVASARPGAASGKDGTRTVPQYVASYSPRVHGLAFTAPVYDEVTRPVVAPYPAACIKSATRCECYSQQGTKLVVPADLCGAIASGGFFVSWQQPVAQAVPLPPPLTPAPLAASGPGVAGFRHVESPRLLPTPPVGGDSPPSRPPL